MSNLLEDPAFIADLKSDLSSRVVADRWPVSKSTVNKYRAALAAKDGLPTVEKFAAIKAEGRYRFEDDGVNVRLDTRATTVAQTHGDVEQSFRDENLDPADFDLTIRRSKWENGAVEEDGELRVLHACSVTARRRPESLTSVDAIDPVGILALLRASTPAHIEPHAFELGSETSTFVLSINDIQLGQSYNGGSDATIKAFHGYIDRAVSRIHELRSIGRTLERLVLICGGDLVEGCFIYPHQMRNIDLNRKQQQQGVVALLLHALDTLAPMFPTVTVLATKGNHGEHREGGKKIDLSDNDDTLCVEMAKLALARDASMQHIDWIIAEEEAAVWCGVYDWTLVTTHGDIYAKGVSGATTERKAHAWLKNMAAAFRRFGRIGRADVLITHHFHHDEMADWGDTLWRQTTSQDRGSPEFSQATGQYSEPGMLSGVMTPTARWQDEAVLR